MSHGLKVKTRQVDMWKVIAMSQREWQAPKFDHDITIGGHVENGSGMVSRWWVMQSIQPSCKVTHGTNLRHMQLDMMVGLNS